MPNIDALAQSLFGRPRLETQEVMTDATTRTYTGVAVSDSEDGTVMVDLGGDVTLPDEFYEDGDEGGTGIEVPCGPSVREGDEVTVTVVGGGPLKSPMVTAAAGEGDWQNRRIDEIEANYIKTVELDAEVGRLGYLTAGSATITDLEAEAAKVRDLTAGQLTAATGYIADLTAGGITVGTLTADHTKLGQVDIDQLTADHAKLGRLDVGQIDADHATIGQLDSTYAQIDGANITTATMREAWVDRLMVQSGLIAHEGTVYTLDAIQVNAASIKAGTLDVERLVVTVGGEKYLVHVDASGTPSYQKLDGGIIEDLTITTDKLVAGAVTAQKITTENLVGSGGWINLRNGTFDYHNAANTSGISWDGSTLTIRGSNLNAQLDTLSSTVSSHGSSIGSMQTSIAQNAEAIELNAAKMTDAGNMLKDTDAPTLTKVYGPANRYWSAGGITSVECSIVEVSDPPEPGITHAARFVCDGTSESAASRGLSFYNHVDTTSLPLKEGSEYVASWWVRRTDGGSGTGVRTTFTYRDNGAGPAAKKPDGTNYDVPTAEWTHCVRTFTLGTISDYNRVWFNAWFAPDTAGTVELCGFRIVPATYATQAQLTVANDAIESKVSSTDYTGAKVASLINQSADSVKIQANHIQVAGSAVFSAINGDTGTTKIDGGKVDVSSITVGSLSDGASYPKTSQVNTAISNAVDGIEVGGRNLLQRSRFRPSGTIYGATFTNNGDGSVTVNGTTTHTPTGYYFDNGNLTLEAGTYTLSGCPEGGGNMSWWLDILGLPEGSPADTGNGVTFTTAGGTPTAIRLRFPSGVTLTDFTVWPKLERGTKATDWTPAPEDVSDGISDAAKTATDYIVADSSGIKIVSSNPSSATTYQRMTSSSTDYYVNGKLKHRINANGNYLYDASGNKVASFENSKITLGESNPQATIELCGGLGSIGYNSDVVNALTIDADNNDLWMGGDKVYLEDNSGNIIGVDLDGGIIRCNDLMFANRNDSIEETFPISSVINAMPVTLYDNASAAASASATLNDSAANYKRLTIFFKDTDGNHSSVEVWSPNGKRVSLGLTWINGASAQQMYQRVRWVTISGTTISTYKGSSDSKYRTGQVRLGGTYDVANGDYISIVHVTGYR